MDAHFTLTLCRRKGRRRRSIFQRALRNPVIRDALMSAPRRRLIWSLQPTPQSQRGFWERNVHGKWLKQARKYIEKSGVPRAMKHINNKYIEMYRVDFHLFNWLLDLCRDSLAKEDTLLRLSIPPGKRLAIVLHWLGQGSSERQLANIYQIGATTVHEIVHQGVSVLLQKLVPLAITFPRGEYLRRDMEEFQVASGLRCCAGALDGTFMRIKKPQLWGDHYWCYKQYPAIVVMATVNARGQFTYVDAGRAGSLGDAFTYNNCSLKTKLDAQQVLYEQFQRVGNVWVRPYLVGDSAFPLSETLMKGFPYPPAPQHTAFNAAVVAARKIVEQAFGGTKKKFKILTKAEFSDPDVAADVALVCCALYNVASRATNPAETTYLVDMARNQPYLGAVPGRLGTAAEVLNALAASV